jgi:hypothetical protein
MINWVTSNWATVIETYLAIVGLASVIVKLTPTLKDDTVLKNIISFVGKFIALNRK